jgi:hypothetical protein
MIASLEYRKIIFAHGKNALVLHFALLMIKLRSRIGCCPSRISTCLMMHHCCMVTYCSSNRFGNILSAILIRSLARHRISLQVCYSARKRQHRHMPIYHFILDIISLQTFRSSSEGTIAWSLSKRVRSTLRERNPPSVDSKAWRSHNSCSMVV